MKKPNWKSIRLNTTKVVVAAISIAAIGALGGFTMVTLPEWTQARSWMSFVILGLAISVIVMLWRKK